MLDFYPDFAYSDAYNYKVVVNKDVKVIDRLPIIDINNSYAHLILKCIQLLDGSILLSSRITVNSSMIPATDISDVFEIQDHLKKLNGMKIRMIEDE